MYGLFYPETRERATQKNYETKQDAVDSFLGKVDWLRIKPQALEDIAAFMNELTGEILVVREI